MDGILPKSFNLLRTPSVGCPLYAGYIKPRTEPKVPCKAFNRALSVFSAERNPNPQWIGHRYP